MCLPDHNSFGQLIWVVPQRIPVLAWPWTAERQMYTWWAPRIPLTSLPVLPASRGRRRFKDVWIRLRIQRLGRVVPRRRVPRRMTLLWRGSQTLLQARLQHQRQMLSLATFPIWVDPVRTREQPLLLTTAAGHW